MTWNPDWTNAPKDKHFLVMFRSGDTELVTTAAFFWETASAYIDGYDGAWWALYDMVRDTPLDDDGPPQYCGMLWMETPT